MERLTKRGVVVRARVGIALLWLASASYAAGESSVAGTWIGEDQRGGPPRPITIELSVHGNEITGTVSIGEDPVQAVSHGRVQGAAVSFTTTAFVNGREIAVTWRGELKDGDLTFTRTVGNGLELPRLFLHRAT